MEVIKYYIFISVVVIEQINTRPENRLADTSLSGSFLLLYQLDKGKKLEII